MGDTRITNVAEQNTMLEIRERIDHVIGVDGDYSHGSQAKFTKPELAAIIVELNGVQTMNDFTVPTTIDVLDETVDFDDWPRSAQRYAVAEANSTIALRERIDELMGFEATGEYSPTDAHEFRSEQLAAIAVALAETLKDD